MLKNIYQMSAKLLHLMLNHQFSIKIIKMKQEKE